MTVTPSPQASNLEAEALMMEDGWGDFLDENPEAKKGFSSLSSLIIFLKEEEEEEDDQNEKLSGMTKEEIAGYWELYQGIKTEKPFGGSTPPPKDQYSLGRSLFIGATWREWEKERKRKYPNKKRIKVLQEAAREVWEDDILTIKITSTPDEHSHKKGKKSPPQKHPSKFHLEMNPGFSSLTEARKNTSMKGKSPETAKETVRKITLGTISYYPKYPQPVFEVEVINTSTGNQGEGTACRLVSRVSSWRERG